MAVVAVTTNQGTLAQSAQDLYESTSQYAGWTLKNRIEYALNYWLGVNNAVVNDYQAGGYLNYGLLPNGQFKIELDGYDIWFDGSFSQYGSVVNSISFQELSTGAFHRLTGEIYYEGIPFFSSLNGVSQIDSLSAKNASNTQFTTLFVDASMSAGMFIVGRLQSMSFGVLDKFGNVLTETAFNGDVVFSNTNGSFVALSGGFTGILLDTQAYPVKLPINVIDSIVVGDVYYQLNDTSSGFNAFWGDDYFELDGSLGSMVYTGDGSDTVRGSSHSDTIYSENGNDLIKGGGGDDYVDGGAGLDFAYYGGSAWEYSLGTNPNGSIQVVDGLLSGDGSDYLINVERLVFNDINVAFDLDGTAGQAYRIYEAVLGRAPDLPGLGYWINDMDNGVSLTTIAMGFIASDEFKQKYGANPSNETYINLLYQNILGRGPDAEGLNYWVTNMNNGIDTPAAVLASFSEGYENTANVMPDIVNGIYYTPYAGWVF